MTSSSAIMVGQYCKSLYRCLNLDNFYLIQFILPTTSDATVLYDLYKIFSKILGIKFVHFKPIVKIVNYLGCTLWYIYKQEKTHL